MDQRNHLGLDEHHALRGKGNVLFVLQGKRTERFDGGFQHAGHRLQKGSAAGSAFVVDLVALDNMLLAETDGPVPLRAEV